MISKWSLKVIFQSFPSHFNIICRDSVWLVFIFLHSSNFIAIPRILYSCFVSTVKSAAKCKQPNLTFVNYMHSSETVFESSFFLRLRRVIALIYPIWDMPNRTIDATKTCSKKTGKKSGIRYDCKIYIYIYIYKYTNRKQLRPNSELAKKTHRRNVTINKSEFPYNWMQLGFTGNCRESRAIESNGVPLPSLRYCASRLFRLARNRQSTKGGRWTREKEMVQHFRALTNKISDRSWSENRAIAFCSDSMWRRSILVGARRRHRPWT